MWLMAFLCQRHDGNLLFPHPRPSPATTVFVFGAAAHAGEGGRGRTRYRTPCRTRSQTRTNADERGRAARGVPSRDRASRKRACRARSNSPGRRPGLGPPLRRGPVGAVHRGRAESAGSRHSAPPTRFPRFISAADVQQVGKPVPPPRRPTSSVIPCQPHSAKSLRQVTPPSHSAKSLGQVARPSRLAKSLSPGGRVAKGRERGCVVAGKDEAKLRSN